MLEMQELSPPLRAAAKMFLTRSVNNLCHPSFKVVGGGVFIIHIVDVVSLGCTPSQV
jgi:hypothetical protein